ncbi:MAG: Gfo/Idh/MocA family oxidoreductase [Gammaproteobacteria bacterium]|nr:Gfo/Idh/MocA family oxidoreductase [Gammaproteobacteria bacterium]
MFRFGILSTAKIGVEHVIPAIQRADNCVVSAIASRDIKKARKLSARFGVSESFGSYEAMLESDTIDAVYIPLPTSQHVEWTLKAAAAGKHVLVEKPVALKAADIKPLIKARDKYGVLISEAFMVTYHPQWLKVRELLAKGAIGELRQVDAVFTYFNKDPSNMRNRPELGGGVLPDIGVYPTVTTRFATGQEPKRVQATVDFDPDFKTDCYASIRAEFETFELSFYLSTQLANRQCIAFHGDKGFIELTAPFNSNLYEGDEVRLHNTGHSETRVFRYTGVEQYQLEVEAFARAATGKKQSVFSLEDSVLNQRLIDAVYKSGKSRRWEKV